MPVGIPLGPYLLVKRLAAGGMAEIFLARKEGPEGFARDLVVKRILPHLAEDPDFTSMFLEEARIAARLTHPNVVHVYDFGEVDGTHYLAMELVRGVDLKALIIRAAEKAIAEGRRGGIPPHHAVKILSFVCEGLAHAHGLVVEGRPAGIVHRDITPSNVLISFDGAVKVADFGIAKAERGMKREATRVGVVKGKYAYMSPEQARGEKLDPRSDVFNVGILLFESLAGMPLFPHNDMKQAKTLTATGQIPNPERIDKLPPALASIVRRALSPLPEQRHPDALTLRSELEAYLRSSPEHSDSVEIGRYIRELFPDVVEEDRREPRAAGTVPRTMVAPITPGQGGSKATAGLSPTTPARKRPPVGFLEPTLPVAAPKGGRPTATVPLPGPLDDDAPTYEEAPTAIELGAYDLVTDDSQTRASAEAPPPPLPLPALPVQREVSTWTGAVRSAAQNKQVLPFALLGGGIVVAALFGVAVWTISAWSGDGPPVEPPVGPPPPDEIALVGTEPPRAPAQLRVVSSPPGLGLAIDGADAGVTPAVIAVAADRSHEVAVLRDGIEVAREIVALRPGEEREVRLSAPAPRASRLRVMTTPAGAEVWIGDEVVGRTPLEREIVPGSYEVAVQLEGYVHQESPVTIRDPGETQTLTFVLRAEPRDDRGTGGRGTGGRGSGGRGSGTTKQQPAPMGRLTIATTPWSEVYLGSRHLGTTPLSGVRLPAGTHTITLRAPGRPAKRMQVTIRPEAETRVREAL